ncbi:MAG: putative inorganic carbon transporter subunit DabA [Bacillus sp. (in: firmicutes)]
MSPTLARKLNAEKESRYLEFDLNALVQSASKVIAPLGPISEFAARHPWEGFERLSFEQTARRLKDICDIDILPNNSVLKSALDRGEIQQTFLKAGLKQWLDSQDLELSKEVAERFCRAALMMDQPPANLVESSEVKRLAKKLSSIKFSYTEKNPVKTYSQIIEKQSELDRHLIKWCKLFLDESQAVWSMPNREEGFYQAWRRLIRFDPELKSSVRKQLSDLPKEADHALLAGLLELEIPFSEIQDYLEAHLLALPGWAGMMLWRSQQSNQEDSLLMEYLAVRISIEAALIKPYLPLHEQNIGEKITLESLIASWIHFCDIPINIFTQLSFAELKARLTLAYRFDKILRKRIWLEAWEQTYESQLMKMIFSKQPSTAKKVETKLAQFIFCIDVRSEPFRRKLEQSGPFETFGAAGFFGLPIETCELGCDQGHNSLPVMFKPQFKIKESTSESKFRQYQQRRQAVHLLGTTFKMMKHNLLSSLVLPEISGPWIGLLTLARSFVPQRTGSAFRKIKEKWLPKPETELSLEHIHFSEMELPIGFTDKEKVSIVRESLKMIGLTENFSPLVVICGHGSNSTNNPYASALDCGACGGASSGINARVLAALCNLPKVRQSLVKDGISIPDDTVFVAVEHITSLDELHWLYVPKLSNSAKAAFDRILETIPNVSEEAKAERISQLPNINSNHKNLKAEAERFAEDWSEVRPEWGLARNASMIIGEREITQDRNLEGRAFLHNYNWKKDENGALLAKIISGPGTVCQWINLQYYASSVAPHYYGSGNKATQTVTGGIGVMQGNASDLLTGLPWQSVMQSDQEFYHAPIRLLVVIQAPKEYVERLLRVDSSFRQKVQNGWIRLASIDPEGNWKSWS